MKPELALLIDGDQGGAEHVSVHLKELQAKWDVTARVCIRNWRSSKDQAAWERAAAELQLECIQHSPQGREKNATDIELAIRAMNLLHGSGYRAFCILSADSDFIPLERRLKRAGAFVDLRPLSTAKASPAPKPKPAAKPAPKTSKPQSKAKPAESKPTENELRFAKVLRKAVHVCRDDGRHDKGWVDIGQLSQALPEGSKKEDFGFAKSRPLYMVLRTLPGIEVKEGQPGKYRVSMAD